VGKVVRAFHFPCFSLATSRHQVA